jgi:Tol biopolymer transport system component
LHSIAADGSGSRRLVSGLGSFRHESWSPDGSELLFTAEPNHREYTVLGIVNVETLELRRYDMGEGLFEPLLAIGEVAWSTDGSQIVISGYYRENNPYNTQSSLYLLDREVTQMRRLTEVGVADFVVQWQP